VLVAVAVVAAVVTDDVSGDVAGWSTFCYCGMSVAPRADVHKRLGGGACKTPTTTTTKVKS